MGLNKRNIEGSKIIVFWGLLKSVCMYIYIYDNDYMVMHMIITLVRRRDQNGIVYTMMILQIVCMINIGD